jgi:hypothetical protein
MKKLCVVTAPSALDSIVEVEEDSGQSSYDSEVDDDEDLENIPTTAAEKATRFDKRCKFRENEERTAIAYKVFPHFN